VDYLQECCLFLNISRISCYFYTQFLSWFHWVREHTLCDFSYFKLVEVFILWTKIWSILVHVLWAPGKSIYSNIGWGTLRVWIASWWLIISLSSPLSLMIIYLAILSVVYKGILKSRTIIGAVFLSLFFFFFLNVCVIPCWVIFILGALKFCYIILASLSMWCCHLFTIHFFSSFSLSFSWFSVYGFLLKLA
jgi:hypothetical protein